MLKILEKYVVKKSVYDLLFETHQELIENYQEKELRVHVLEEKVKAMELNEVENKPKKGTVKAKPVVVKKEVEKDGSKKTSDITKKVSKRGRPRKSENS